MCKGCHQQPINRSDRLHFEEMSDVYQREVFKSTATTTTNYVNRLFFSKESDVYRRKALRPDKTRTPRRRNYSYANDLYFRYTHEYTRHILRQVAGT